MADGAEGKATGGGIGAVQVGGQVDIIKALITRPEYGLIFLVVLVAEAALFMLFLRSTDQIERLVMLGIFAVLLLATLVALVFVVRILTPKPMVPSALLAKPIPAAEATRRTDLVYDVAPADRAAASADGPVFADNTFAFARPPVGWTYEMTSVEEDMVRALGAQMLGEEVTASAVKLPFRAGRVVVFSAEGEHVIAYEPGRSTINGRLTLGALDDRLRDQVRIFSVSKAGNLVREVTAQHVFTQLLAMVISGGVQITEIGQEVFGDAGRSALTARGVMMFDGVLVDGQGPTSGTLEVRLYVVERADYLYVLRTVQLLGTPAAQTRAREMAAIIAGFQPVTPADAPERARLDREAADANWATMVAGMASGILVTKATTLVAQVEHSGEVSVQQQRAATLLAGYGKAFANVVDPRLVEILDAVRDAALNGDVATLAEIAAMLAKNTPPDDGAPDAPAAPDQPPSATAIQ